MSLVFEWDSEKAEANRKKHRMTFEEALTVFADPLSLTIQDPDHSTGELRFANIGRSAGGHTLVVIHVERGENIRIISARKASRQERQTYEEGTG